MTEWEKLQSGQMYNDFDNDLFQRRIAAKKLFRKYNKTEDEEVELRNQIMNDLFKHVGKDVWIEPDFRCEFGKNISIGDDVYINFGCVILDCGPVTIGNQVLISPNVGIYDASHALDAQERMDGALIPGKIRIGNRVWIGGGTIILPGVTIGDDTVIGAGSIVTHDIPSGVVAVGNPCRVLRKLTDKDKVGYQNPKLENDVK